MLRSILITALAVGLALVVWNSTITRAADFTETWTFGGLPDQNFEVGDTLTFEFSGGHDLWEFPDEAAFDACDFSSATFIAASTVLVNFNTVGVRYFGCSVGSHCANTGMKVRVTTSPSSSIFADGFESGTTAEWSSSVP